MEQTRKSVIESSYEQSEGDTMNMKAKMRVLGLTLVI